MHGVQSTTTYICELWTRRRRFGRFRALLSWWRARGGWWAKSATDDSSASGSRSRPRFCQTDKPSPRRCWWECLSWTRLRSISARNRAHFENSSGSSARRSIAPLLLLLGLLGYYCCISPSPCWNLQQFNSRQFNLLVNNFYPPLPPATWWMILYKCIFTTFKFAKNLNKFKMLLQVEFNCKSLWAINCKHTWTIITWCTRNHVSVFAGRHLRNMINAQVKHFLRPFIIIECKNVSICIVSFYVWAKKKKKVLKSYWLDELGFYLLYCSIRLVHISASQNDSCSCNVKFLYLLCSMCLINILIELLHDHQKMWNVFFSPLFSA